MINMGKAFLMFLKNILSRARVLEISCLIVARRYPDIIIVRLYYCRSAYLPLRSNDPVIPSQLREAHVETLFATLALYCAAAFDRPSSHTLYGCWIRTHD